MRGIGKYPKGPPDPGWDLLSVFPLFAFVLSLYASGNPISDSRLHHPSRRPKLTA
jgi:hypothetical protein